MFCSVGQRPFTALFVLLHRLRPWRKVECISLVSVLSGKKHMGKNGTLHTHTRLTALFPGLPGWAGTRKVKPNWILFTEARDSEWQWHQLGHMQVCTSFQTDNHASTSPLHFLQAGCPSCCPTNSVKALKAMEHCTSVQNLYTSIVAGNPQTAARCMIQAFNHCTWAGLVAVILAFEETAGDAGYFVLYKLWLPWTLTLLPYVCAILVVSVI